MRPVTAQEKQQLRTSGSLVVEDAGGAAARAGIEPGDIILGIGATDVTTAEQLKALAAKTTSRNIPLRVQRGESIRFAQVPRDQG